jgi:glutamate dehydrogenase (NAD(P)+)
MEIRQSGESEPNHAIKIDKVVHVLENVNVSAFLDKWGPTHVMQVYNPDEKVQGVLIIDNTTLGPGCGGIEISPATTPLEVFQRARTMTWSCALLNLNLGGAAAGIRANHLEIDKGDAVRFFAREISPYVPDQYIAAPGPNVGQDEMKAFAEEVGDRQGATGKPLGMGGIPHELGATGLGIGVTIETTIEVAQSSMSIPPSISEAKIALQGFGNVSYTAAKYLSNNGARIVAISDDWCTICSDKGIDMDNIPKSFSEEPVEARSLSHCKEVKKLPKEDITDIDCDMFIISSGSKPLTEESVSRLKASLVVEGLGRSISSRAEQKLYKKGILVIPDILATAGAPISSHAEHDGIRYERAFSLIESRLRECTKEVIQQAIELDIPPRRTATEIAKEGILRTMEAVH